jgi:hypothetical protein
VSDDASMTVCVVVALVALAVGMFAAEWAKRWMKRYPDVMPIGPILLGSAAFLFWVMSVWAVGQRL